MATDVVAPESDLVTALMSASELQRGLDRDSHAAPHPSDNLLSSRPGLARLVNALFWTSLATEEGRTITGSVCICSPAQAPRSRAFTRPEALTLQSLTTLLTASPNAPVGVHIVDEELEIWGFLDSRPPFSVTLRIGGPGTVVALRHHVTVALLHEGRMHVSLEAHDVRLTQILSQTFERESTFPELFTLALNLRKAIVAMHNQHHGGAIVVVPTPGDVWRRSVDLRFQFNADSSSSLPEQVVALGEARAMKDARVLDAQLAFFYKTLRTIGQLTAIDGALVLREDLTVLGFGAKLKYPSADFKVTKFNELTGALEECPISELGGTRHQSAARFVNQHHECSVVVSSQDGRLTLIAWVHDPGSVIAITGLEHFLWGEVT